ncbi:MAG: glycosyltransferase family 2 protein, partial [Limosilactobacillus sp.]|nr:glycosyltransferase family 2 protein [Limosilactobacillus sp.]
MDSNVLLSVIIPTYNDGKLLQRAVDSVLHSSLQNIEVIIVNDGSSEKLELFCNDKRVSILNQDNQGVSVARNNGLNHSTGEYILFLDADDYLVSGWERFIF